MTLEKIGLFYHEFVVVSNKAVRPIFNNKYLFIVLFKLSPPAIKASCSESSNRKTAAMLPFFISYFVISEAFIAIDLITFKTVMLAS